MGDVDDMRSEQLPAARASAQVEVTRIAVNWRRHVSIVTACLHSEMSRAQSFSELIGRRTLEEPDEVEPLELVEEDVVPEPGIGSQATSTTEDVAMQAKDESFEMRTGSPIKRASILPAERSSCCDFYATGQHLQIRRSMSADCR
jgi:hypothetical protein